MFEVIIVVVIIVVVKVEMFDVRNHQEFFTSSERSFLVHNILSSPGRRLEVCDDCIDPKQLVDRRQVVDENFDESTEPLHHLVRKGVYAEAFPLHDGPLKGRRTLLLLLLFLREDQMRHPKTRPTAISRVLSVQSIYSQTVLSNCTLKLYSQTVLSNCTIRLYSQTVP